MNRLLIASLALDKPENSNLDSLMVGSRRKDNKMPGRIERVRLGADSLVTLEKPNLRQVPDEDCSVGQCKRQAQVELVKKTFEGAQGVDDQMARLKELVKVLGVQKDKPPSRQQAQPRQTKPWKLSSSSSLAGIDMEDPGMEEWSRSTSKNSSLSGRSTSMSPGDVPDCASSTCPSETILENGSIPDESEAFDSRMEPMKIELAPTCFGCPPPGLGCPPPGLGYPPPGLQRMQGPMPLYVEPGLGGRCTF